MPVDRPNHIVASDIDADFIETATTRLAWEYEDLADRLVERKSVPGIFQAEEFRRGRSYCATAALTHACSKHGIPYEMRRLACNGQRKLLVKAGRVILIQEPIIGHADGPRIADYKVDLADMHGFVRQLKLPLNDRLGFTTDWSGHVLAVLLHGPSGNGFDRKSIALQNVFLGIPDAAYQHWTHRYDLHDVALFGRSPARLKPGLTQPSGQEDNVTVTPKRRNRKKTDGS